MNKKKKKKSQQADKTVLLLLLLMLLLLFLIKGIIMYCILLYIPQRHFAVFAVSFPNQEALSTIYTSILSQHLSFAGFLGTVQRFATQMVQGALALHSRISQTFLPTAIKFHYIFNLRDLSNIFQVYYGFSVGKRMCV